MDQLLASISKSPMGRAEARHPSESESRLMEGAGCAGLARQECTSRSARGAPAQPSVVERSANVSRVVSTHRPGWLPWPRRSDRAPPPVRGLPAVLRRGQEDQRTPSKAGDRHLAHGRTRRSVGAKVRWQALLIPLTLKSAGSQEARKSTGRFILYGETKCWRAPWWRFNRVERDQPERGAVRWLKPEVDSRGSGGTGSCGPRVSRSSPCP